MERLTGVAVPVATLILIKSIRICKNRSHWCEVIRAACVCVCCVRALFPPHRSTPWESFLLYLLLQVYPPVGIRPIVSGFINVCRNTLLHTNAIARDSNFPIYKNSLLKTRQASLITLTSSRHYDSNTRLLSKGSDICLSHHARIPSSTHHSSPHRSTICRT